MWYEQRATEGRAVLLVSRSEGILFWCASFIYVVDVSRGEPQKCSSTHITHTSTEVQAQAILCDGQTADVPALFPFHLCSDAAEISLPGPINNMTN